MKAVQTIKALLHKPIIIIPLESSEIDSPVIWHNAHCKSTKVKQWASAAKWFKSSFLLQVILLQVSSLRIFLPSLKISKNAFSCRTFVFQVLQVKGRWFYEPGSKRPHHSIPSNLPLTSEPRDMFCFPKLHFHLFSLSTEHQALSSYFLSKSQHCTVLHSLYLFLYAPSQCTVDICFRILISVKE